MHTKRHGTDRDEHRSSNSKANTSNMMNQHRPGDRKRFPDLESDRLFPQQNYYQPSQNDQGHYDQRQENYGQFGFGQDFSTGISGGSPYRKDNNNGMNGAYSSMGEGYLGSSSMGGNYLQDNAYQGTSPWTGQSSYDKDSSYGREQTRHGSNQVGRVNGKWPKGYKRSDERIRDDVCEAFYFDSEIDASEIEVVVHDGEVTLSGIAESRQMKRMIEDCSEKVAGVKDVRNDIRVQTVSQTDRYFRSTGNSTEDSLNSGDRSEKSKKSSVGSGNRLM